MTLNRQFLVLMLLASTGGIMTGCGGGTTDTGAGTDVTVKVKPSELEQSDPLAASAGTTDSGTSPGAAAGTTGPAAGGSGPATFRGKITFKDDGTRAPLFAAGASIKDAAVCAAEAIPDESLVVNDGGLANVFIYLERAPSGGEEGGEADTEVVFDNLNCVFVPHALLVQTGATIRVTNSDPVAHNTHTFPARNDPFNSVLKVNDKEGIPFSYRRAEKVPVQVKCDLHAWMKAWHLPLDHPYGTVSGKDGSFEIANLPQGTHKFRIWHETVGYLDRGYEVKIAGEDVEVEISYGQSDLAGFDGPRPRQVTIAASR